MTVGLAGCAGFEENSRQSRCSGLVVTGLLAAVNDASRRIDEAIAPPVLTSRRY